jgi:hypothetical protein
MRSDKPYHPRPDQRRKDLTRVSTLLPISTCTQWLVWLSTRPCDVEGTSDCAFLTGDIIHHPIQFLVPDLVNPGDVDPALARTFRDSLLGEIAGRGALLLPGHFPDPSVGRIYDRPDGYRFEFDWE